VILAECGALAVDGFLYDHDHTAHIPQSVGGAVGGVDVIGNSGDKGQVLR
jgi:hypothetical protein